VAKKKHSIKRERQAGGAKSPCKTITRQREGKDKNEDKSKDNTIQHNMATRAGPARYCYNLNGKKIPVRKCEGIGSSIGVVPIAFFMVVWDWEPFYGAKPR
jgi:hypothetical protein